MLSTGHVIQPTSLFAMYGLMALTNVPAWPCTVNPNKLALIKKNEASVASIVFESINSKVER